MLTEVGSNMMETILRGHGSAMDLKMILSENKEILMGSDPRVAACLEDVIQSFLRLSGLLISSLDSSTSTQHNLNNNSNDDENEKENMVGRSSAKGKEVVTAIEHHSDDSPDSLTWRKYGQKSIKNCIQTRSYYKCMQCNAKKKVQKFEDNVSMCTTNYVGLHTCQAVVLSNPVNDDASSSNMIQFGSQEETQDQTMINSFFPSILPQIVHQETINVAHTATKQVYDDQFLGSEFPYLTYGDPIPPLGDIVQQESMNQDWDDQLWGSGFSFLPYGDPTFDDDFNKNF